MKYLVFIALFLSVSLSYAQNRNLKKTEDYRNFYQSYFDSVYKSGDRIYLFQNKFWTLNKADYREIDVSYDYLKYDYNINDSLFLQLYENWFLNLSKQTIVNYSKGISEKKKNRILKKKRDFIYKNTPYSDYSHDYVVSIAPPFWINKSLVMLQVWNYCDGLCNSSRIIFLKRDEISGEYKYFFYDGIFMQ